MEDDGAESALAEPGADDGPRAVRIGVTGHMDLGPETIRLVTEALRKHLCGLVQSRPRNVVGVSCLAPGADRVFACVLLDLGGSLEAIIPSGEYDGMSTDPDDDSILGELLRRAASVCTIKWPRTRPHVYVAANNAMLDSIDLLFAVWDGAWSDKLGGTAHVVRTAQSRRIPVTVIWPEGARRRG